MYEIEILMRKNQQGFTLIEILVALTALIIILAGGKIVWEKNISSTPTPQVLPTPIVIPTWTQSCLTDNDCPKQFCQPPGTPCAQYSCILGKCQLIKPPTNSSCQTDADCPSLACIQGCPVEGPCPPCPQNKCIHAECQIVYPDYSESLNKKIQLVVRQTVTVAEANLSLTLLKITPAPGGCLDCPATAEVKVQSDSYSQNISFTVGVLANQETAAKMRVQEALGFRITLEKLGFENITLLVEKL